MGTPWHYLLKDQHISFDKYLADEATNAFCAGQAMDCDVVRPAGLRKSSLQTGDLFVRGDEREALYWQQLRNFKIPRMRPAIEADTYGTCFTIA